MVIFAAAVALILIGAEAGLFMLILSWTVASLFANGHFAAQARHDLESRLTLWAVRRSAGEFEHYDGWKDLGRKLGRWWAMQQRPARSPS